MRVNVGILIVRIVSSILRGIGAHNEMLCGNRTKRNLILSTITIIELFKIRNNRYSCSVHERQTPSRTSFQSSIKTLVATEVKVTESTTARNIIITGLVIPLINNFTIRMTNRSTNHRIPHLGRNQGFQRLTKPSKIRMGVCDSKDRTMDWDFNTFRKRKNFNREIPKSM